jgi:hypothetical protein
MGQVVILSLGIKITGIDVDILAMRHVSEVNTFSFLEFFSLRDAY